MLQTKPSLNDLSATKSIPLTGIDTISIDLIEKESAVMKAIDTNDGDVTVKIMKGDTLDTGPSPRPRNIAKSNTLTQI